MKAIVFYNVTASDWSVYTFPTISISPSDLTAEESDEILFTATYANGDSIEWFVDGVTTNITTDTYTHTVGASDEEVTCKVTNDFVVIESSPTSITVVT